MGARAVPARPLANGRLRLRPTDTTPLRLERIVVSHGWFQTPPFRWDPSARVLTRRERVATSVVDVAISPAGAGVWVAPSAALTARERRELGRRVRRMLQLDVSLDGFHDAVATFDPHLADDLAIEDAGRLLAGASLWEDVAKAICGTNVAWRQAVSMIEKIGSLDPDGAFPEPERLLDAGEDRLREFARVGYRAPYLLGAARMATEGEIAALEVDTPHLPPEELLRRLTDIPGIGPTTARFVAYLAGRFDIGLAIDSATVPAAGDRWFDGHRPTHEEIAEKVAPAGDWAALALYWATMRRWQQGLERRAPTQLT